MNKRPILALVGQHLLSSLSSSSSFPTDPTKVRHRQIWPN